MFIRYVQSIYLTVISVLFRLSNKCGINAHVSLKISHYMGCIDFLQGAHVTTLSSHKLQMGRAVSSSHLGTALVLWWVFIISVIFLQIIIVINKIDTTVTKYVYLQTVFVFQ